MQKTSLQNYFDEQYCVTARSLSLTSERSSEEVRKIIDLLKIGKDERVLDLGCGWGRHSFAFAALGHSTVGVDQSEAMISRAQKHAAGTNLPVRFIKGNYYDVKIDSKFDIVVFLFGSFGFGCDSTADTRLLQNMFSVLNPGGRILIDQWNPQRMISLHGKSVEEDGLVESYIYAPDTKCFTITRRYIKTSDNLDRKLIIRLYSYEEIKEMLLVARFEKISLYSDYSGHAFSEDAKNMIFVAEKVLHE